MSHQLLFCKRQFFTISILCLWLRIIRRSNQGVFFISFPSQIFFNNINHSYRAAILKKILCGWFHFIWLWLLIAIMKRCTEQCTLQLYRTYLNKPKYLAILICFGKQMLRTLKGYWIRNFLGLFHLVLH